MNLLTNARPLFAMLLLTLHCASSPSQATPPTKANTMQAAPESRQTSTVATNRFIALLPFADAETGLANGLHYALLYALAHSTNAIVLSARSPFAGLSQTNPAATIADGADLVVSGKITNSATGLRVNVHLYQPSEDEKVERELQIELPAHRSITSKVAAAIATSAESMVDASFNKEEIATFRIGDDETSEKFFDSMQMAASQSRKANRSLGRLKHQIAKLMRIYLQQYDRARPTSIKKALAKLAEKPAERHFLQALATSLAWRHPSADYPKVLLASTQAASARHQLWQAMLARSHWQAERYEQAVGAAESALAWWQKRADRFAARLSVLIGSSLAASKKGAESQELVAQHYQQAQKIYLRYPTPSIDTAILQFHQGNRLLGQSKPSLAAEKYKQTAIFLAGHPAANSELHHRIVLNLGIALFAQKQWQDSRYWLVAIQRACESLFLRRNLTCAQSYHYDALAQKQLGNKKVAKQQGRQAARIYGRLRLRKLAAAARRLRGNPIAAPDHDPFAIGLTNALGMSELEDELLYSYSAPRYRTSAAAFARTYGKRLDDTNVMMRDIITGKKANPQLQALRSGAHHESMTTGGKGVLFVDIGPAVANIITPAVTSVNVAHDFPQMEVVALDLPDEFKIYRKKVLKSAKKRLRSYKNLYLFSGDGTVSLKKQFAQKKRWILRDRAQPSTDKSQLIVIRAANSIDIYVKYKYVRPAIRDMALDFREKPVLLFFNRSILWKPAGRSYFKIVGFLSVRGFHHNKRSLDRGGHAPYTLMPALFVKR